MNRHSGGEAHTRYLIELSLLPPGSCWMDFGAGDGEAVRILKNLGYEAQGLDMCPIGENVAEGDFLHTDFKDAFFNGILSQCSFYASGNAMQAFREVSRLLQKEENWLFTMSASISPKCCSS